MRTLVKITIFAFLAVASAEPYEIKVPSYSNQPYKTTILKISGERTARNIEIKENYSIPSEEIEYESWTFNCIEKTYRLVGAGRTYEEMKKSDSKHPFTKINERGDWKYNEACKISEE